LSTARSCGQGSASNSVCKPELFSLKERETKKLMTEKKRSIVVRHAAGVSPELSVKIDTERALERLIAGEGEVDVRQIRSVVSKLHVVLADYLESGKSMQIALNPLEIVSAVDAAIEEAEGRASPWPDGADVRAFFLHGLYDELVQQPSNIFETKIFPDGSERYIPISRATWKACLAKLKETLIVGSLKRVGKGNKKNADD
jgi:hypothetical protein